MTAESLYRSLAQSFVTYCIPVLCSHQLSSINLWFAVLGSRVSFLPAPSPLCLPRDPLSPPSLLMSTSLAEELAYRVAASHTRSDLGAGRSLVPASTPSGPGRTVGRSLAHASFGM